MRTSSSLFNLIKLNHVLKFRIRVHSILDRHLGNETFSEFLLCTCNVVMHKGEMKTETGRSAISQSRLLAMEELCGLRLGPERVKLNSGK